MSISRPSRPIPSNAVEAASLSWLARFQVCLEAECLELFGPGWRVSVDPQNLAISIQRPAIAKVVTLPLHPGLHVVAPIYAAHRMADHLHLTAMAQGLVEVPSAAADATAPRDRAD